MQGTVHGQLSQTMPRRVYQYPEPRLRVREELFEEIIHGFQ